MQSNLFLFYQQTKQRNQCKLSFNCKKEKCIGFFVFLMNNMELNKKYKIEFDYEYNRNNIITDLTYSSYFILREGEDKNIIIEILNANILYCV